MNHCVNMFLRLHKSICARDGERQRERVNFYSSCGTYLMVLPTFALCETDSNRGCVAKLSFSCPLKGHYCLYAKSCFNLTSRQPHVWIYIMLLHLQVHQIFTCKSQKHVIVQASLSIQNSSKYSKHPSAVCILRNNDIKGQFYLSKAQLGCGTGIFRSYLNCVYCSDITLHLKYVSDSKTPCVIFESI